MIKLDKTLLLLACLAVAGVSCSDSGGNPQEGGEPTPPPVEVAGDVSLYVTTANRAHDLTPASVDFSDNGSNMSPTTIRLDAAVITYDHLTGRASAIRPLSREFAV